MPGMRLGVWQVLSAPSISEPLGFNGHYCPPEDLNSSWLWSYSLIHSACLSLQGRPSSFHKPWSQRHFLWNQERISSDQIPSYLAFRLKKHSFIYWFIYSLDKYIVDVNHVFGPGQALGLQWWARQGPAIKKLPALGRGIWFQGRLEGWGCHSQNQCSLCSQNPSHIPYGSGYPSRSFVYTLDASTRVSREFLLLASFQVQLNNFSITQSSQFPG